MTLKVDANTKAQAIEYADNEAEIHGFQKGSSKWQEAATNYIKFAITTMSVGRNPRGFRYKIYSALYPSVLGAKGFAGKVAREYTDQSGKQGVNIRDIENRILASITNLSKLYENGILGVRTTTVGGEQGSIPVDKASDLQFPKKEEFTGNYDAKVNEVLQSWIMRDIVCTIIMECLKPFFNMSEQDFTALASRIKLSEVTMDSIRKGEREKLIQEIQKLLAPQFDRIDIVKILLT